MEEGRRRDERETKEGEEIEVKTGCEKKDGIRVYQEKRRKE